MRSRYRLMLAGLLATFVYQTDAAAQSISVRNAASFTATSVAPGSIVSIFGSNLTNTTAEVTDPANPPVTLGGTSLTIGGVAATLFYVSPSQINAVVPASAPLGTEPVVVTSPTGQRNGTVAIAADAAPGLFSLTGTGTNDGAIIQALTGRIGAFSVNDGSAPNFLSLFLTGANLSSAPVVTVGGVSVTVTFAGASPCCAGLQQINITLPASLAGAGRVPVVVQAGGQLSNAVEIVILPAQGAGEFASDQDNQTRSRELSGIAWIPGTSLALVADENDDVVREIDIAGKTVAHTISLAGNSEPVAVAVNAAGTLAVVAERNNAKVALINLGTLTVQAYVPTSIGPVAVAITGNTAVVANGDSASVTLVDLPSATALATIGTGAGPRGVAIDAAAAYAYVTNQNDGTISVIDLAKRSVVTTLNLGQSRPSAIQLIGSTGFAIVTDPATSPNGKVLVVNLTTGSVTPFSVNVEHTGGSNDVAMVGTTAYIANQTGGSFSVLPLTISGTTVTGTATTVKVGQGVRSLAIDTKDNVLLAVNESTGKVAVVSLASDQVIASIVSVLGAPGEGDDGNDDHSDHAATPNAPRLTSISPVSGNAGTTFVLTLTGTDLQGATSVAFFSPAAIPGNGQGQGKGAGGNDGKADAAFTVTNIQVNTAGTQLTATVAVAANAPAGVRFVQVSTPNGESAALQTLNDTFTLLP